MEKEEFQYSLVNKDGGQFKDWSFFLSLYTPIVGPQATALYFSLVNEEAILRHLNYPRFELTRLYQITSINEKSFNESIKKLESLKLVKTKISRNKKLKRFELFAPLEPNEFFANEIFEKTLLTKIGLENVEALKFIFKEKSDIDVEEDFEDITATFEDVFPEELRNMTQTTTMETNINNLRSSKRTLFEKMFNLKSLNDRLKKANVNLNYNASKNKRAFNWALSLYNFNEEDFAKLIIESYDKTKQGLDFKYFQNGVETFVLKQKQKISKGLEATQKLTDLTLTPENWAQNFLQQPLDLNFYKLLKKFREDYQFDNETINALMDFSCFVNQGKVIPNYLYKVADTVVEHQMGESKIIIRYLNDLKSQKQVKVPLEPTFNQSAIPTYDEVMNLVSKI
ncbi:replicative DNA helicase loader DnaB [Entomoplasma freundtii]|uniref:Chromosome replication initiation and membrane attachment protein n=1 Tax=Entomoplasma freundtii TaxID=74700 RepID=A0A2K8NRR3_9MOLU|nr:hypothetical protein [Entomoplasma freundtii]ATZ16454.1 chromosome replication initiation and membrane attachment protein [Entomoplasma freundtii]TDY55984.1 replicative DNA helicase loader DnaB [Entomoplasma freundtii]